MVDKKEEAAIVSDSTKTPSPVPPEHQPFNERGIEVLRYVEGVSSRPISHFDPEGDFGRKNYIGINRELQQKLGIEKPSDHVVAVLTYDDDEETPQNTEFYILSGLLPDEDWEHEGQMRPGFFSRARDGHYLKDGIYSEAEAREIAEEYTLGEDSFGTPFFAHDLDDPVDETPFDMVIMNTREMQGRLVNTQLSSKAIQGGYPTRLINQWENAKKSLRLTCPTLVVPNAVAKLAGLDMTSSTNQPETLGKTVSEGGLCDVVLPDGTEMQAFVVGALDSVGVSRELYGKFDQYKPLVVTISVGGQKLMFKTVE